jgi:hypothetical protein
MTQPASPAPDKCCAAERLSGPVRRVHLAVLATFSATGQPPPPAELDRLACAHGGQPGPVLAELAGADVLAFTADGQIRAAYPFSPAPTAIQVSWAGGPQAYAMCAIDALGMSAMLGRPVTIIAAEPGTGRTITVAVDRDRARWKPRTAVVFAGAACGAGGPAADRSCGYINFFTTSRAARGLGPPPPRGHRHPHAPGRRAQVRHRRIRRPASFVRADGWPKPARARLR